MSKYIQFISKNRKKLIILLVVLNLLAFVGLFKIDINAEFDLFKVKDSEQLDIINEMKSVFGDDDQTLMLVTAKEDVETTIDEVDKILKEKVAFTSPAQLLELINNMPGAAETSLSPIIQNGNETYVTYRLNTEADFDFEPILQAFEAAGLKAYFSGDAYIQYQIVHMIIGVLLRIPPVALTLVLLTFRSQLSSFKAAFLSVMPAGLAALWTLGLIGWFGGQVSIVTVLAPIFSIVIGSADGLHFITHMEEEFYNGATPKAALQHTLGIVGMPMIITTTTSMAGFMGLMLINTSAIQDLAIFASIGVFLAGIITWYILPIIFTGGISLTYHQKKSNMISLQRLWGKRSIIIASVFILLAVSFIPSLQAEFNQLMFFKPSTDVQKNFEKVIDINGGAVPIYYYGHFPLDERSSNFTAISEFLDSVSKDKDVARLINPLGMVSTLETPSLQMLSAAKDFIRIKDDQMYYRFLVFPKDLDNQTITNIADLEQETQVQGRFTGVQFMMKELNQTVVKGQVLSILFTLLLIFFMLLISLKSLKLSLIACLPIILTSIILYGFMGMTGISLTLMTSTIFSITLGIGVDYAIHYISVYKYYKDRDHATPSVIAYNYTARPVVANAFGLALGMSALWLSPLLIHMQISALMWISMVSAVFMSLTLLPTLLQKKKTLL